MTVLEWTTSAGQAGRCDETCHKAYEAHCRCFCGGHLHGALARPGGLAGAYDRAVAHARLQARLVGAALKVQPLQLEIFGAAS